MSGIIVFAVVPETHPQAVFVAADAEIRFGEATISGRIFLAARHGEVAACVRVEDTFTGTADLAQLAQRGRLTAKAEFDDRNGLTVVNRIWLHCAGGNSAWRDGQHHSLLGTECRAWYGHIITAQMAIGSRAMIPVPSAARPAGDSELQTINIAGDIGKGQNTAASFEVFSAIPIACAPPC